MHSSRMRTARLLPVSPSMHCSQGGVPAQWGCTCPGGGCTWPGRGCTCPGGYLPRRVPAWGGLPAQGVYLPRGVYLRGGCTCPRGCTCQGGVPAQGGGVPAQGCVPAGGVPAQVLPPVNRMTDRCKNITLPQTSFAGAKKVWGKIMFLHLSVILFAGVGVYPSMQWAGRCVSQHAMRQGVSASARLRVCTPPWTHTHTPGQTPIVDTPSDRHLPPPNTPPGRHPLSRHTLDTPQGRPPRTHPQTHDPLDTHPPGKHPRRDDH